MEFSNRAFTVEVLLSFQGALLERVTSSLRAVVVMPRGPRIHARFLYDGLVEDDLEIVSEAETWVAADFNDPVTVDFRAVDVPAPGSLVLEEGEVWVYRRREGEPYWPDAAWTAS